MIRSSLQSSIIFSPIKYTDNQTEKPKATQLERIAEILLKGGFYNTRQLAKETNTPIASATRYTVDLYVKGFIFYIGKRRDKETNYPANFFTLSPSGKEHFKKLKISKKKGRKQA